MTSPESQAAAVSGAQAVARQVAMVSQQAAQIQSNAKSFAASAGAGFHIEPEAAATLIKACQDSIHELDGLMNHLQVIRQAPKLGETPGAKVIAQFTQHVATDPLGMIPAIQNLKTTLNNMVDAYRKASTNYAETEAIITQSLKGSGNPK